MTQEKTKKSYTAKVKETIFDDKTQSTKCCIIVSVVAFLLFAFLITIIIINFIKSD
jgi:hypothetical protein